MGCIGIHLWYEHYDNDLEMVEATAEVKALYEKAAAEEKVAEEAVAEDSGEGELGCEKWFKEENTDVQYIEDQDVKDEKAKAG